jgi:hypothetical protein
LIDYTLDIDPKDPHQLVQNVSKGEVCFVDYEMPDELLALEAKAFLNAVRTGASLPNHGENGLHVVRMLETVEQMMNANAKKTPIPQFIHS